MEIQKIEDYFKGKLPNTDYWNQFIGDGEFDYDYLEEQFESSHPKFNKNNQYLLIIFNKELIGITVYRKLTYVPIYKICLLAKKKNCQQSGIGRLVFNYLESTLRRGYFILVDDSRIPHYYSKLGFKRSWGGVNCLFGEFQNFSYYKYFYKKNI